MRLIDADELNEQKIPAIKKDSVIYVKLSTLQDLIDNAPTVKAISIDRLKAFRNDVMNMNSIAIIHRLDKLIAESEE